MVWLMDTRALVTEPIQVGEAATILNVDRKTVHRYIKAKKLTVYRKKSGPRGAILILESDVRALAAKRLLEQEARTAAARRHLEQVA